MKILLDTSALIFFDNDEKLLSKKAVAAIQDKSNIIYLSAASIWEISIKTKLGKLKIPDGIETLTNRIRLQYKIRILPITPEVIVVQHVLPSIKDHKDPFDRIIIAQGIRERMPIITPDAWFGNYAVKTIW